MSMTRRDHIAVARGIANTEMDDETRKALCLSILDEITPNSKGLDRELFIAFSFLTTDVDIR